MEIKLKAKSVYGKVLVYPVCEKSNLLIRLTGKKTFDDTDMFVLERLGYSVSWEAEKMLPNILRAGDIVSESELDLLLNPEQHHETGFIFGLLTALAVSVPVMLADHMAIIPGSLVFFVRDSFWYLGSQIF
jgi:hypothetical protein